MLKKTFPQILYVNQRAEVPLRKFIYLGEVSGKNYAAETVKVKGKRFSLNRLCGVICAGCFWSAAK